MRLVRFDVEGQGYALNLQVVERVIRAVELNALPGSPPVIRGIFSLHGRIVPVADPRRRLGLPEREIGLDDRIIIARTPKRLLALLADGNTSVVECEPEELVKPDRVLDGLGGLEGIARLKDGLVLIHDLGRFLSLEEERSLAEALRAGD